MGSKESYLYLDINGKLDYNFFQKEDVFFKIVNLHKEHPLVQIGNYVFQGTYEDDLGTKLFFVEDETPKQDDNIFIKKTPIHLKYLCKTAKTLKLKWRKILNTVVQVDENELLDLKFSEDYSTVLKKFEKGLLVIDDVVSNDQNQTSKIESNETTEKKSSADTISEPIPVIKNDTDVQTNLPTQTPVDKYRILKDLARTPTKNHEFQKVYEVDPKNLANVTDSGNFVILKQLFLQSLLLDKLPLDIESNNFDEYVDLNKSFEDGIITTIDVGLLTEQDKQALLSPSNFDNFSLPMKLTYLIEQLKEHKRIMLKMSKQELNLPDKYERTPKDRYKLLKRLTKDLWYYIYSHYADVSDETN